MSTHNIGFYEDSTKFLSLNYHQICTLFLLLTNPHLFLYFIFQSSNRLVKEVGNAAKETDLTFKYKAKDPKKKIEKSSLPFQVN